MKVIFIVLLTFLKVPCSTCTPPSVTLPLGKVEGYIGQTVNGRSYYAFEGLPYAHPPIGKFRFKPPAPPKKWNGTWQSKTMFKCMQYDHFTPSGQNMVSGDEDCLYVNVYSPNLIPSKKLNVLVYIHGGAFMFNSGAIQGPQILLDRDIVYVNLNYRLGPLGFLSTENDVVPGNNGLKDQIMALRWIKENIENFGGNPNSITISGMSAGGASVELHYLFPKSKGLFHRGISQSGSSLNAWVLVENPLEKAKKVSNIVGCPTMEAKDMVDCLQSRPGRQITKTVKHFQPWLYNPFSPFGVVLDSWAADPLLPDHPYNLLKNGRVEDVPWIISYTSAEGLYPASEFYQDDHLRYIDEHWNEIMPYVLHYNDVVAPQFQNDISQKIRQEYLNGKNVTKGTFQKFVQILSDRLFVADIEKASRLHSAAVKSPVYSYYFDYRGAHSKSEKRTKSSDNIGVSHGDDTSYIFKTNMDVLSTEDDRLMSKIMVNMFTSFMENGKPNITSEWKPLSKTTTDPWVQLNIQNPHKFYIEDKKQLGNRDFWDALPFAENEKLLKRKDEL